MVFKTKLDLNKISDHPFELPMLIFVLAVMEIRVGVDQTKAQSHGGEVAISKAIWRRGYHNWHQYILTNFESET